MRPDLDDPPLIDDDDAVGAHRGREAVRDQDRGAALQQAVERLLDEGLGLEVEIRGRLVEHEHAGTCEKCSCERDELAFSRRKGLPALVHRRVDPVRESLHQFGEPDRLDRLEHLLLGRFGPGERDVVADRAGEQERLLGNDAELAAEGVDLHRLEGDAVDVDVPRSRVVEAGDELGDRRLSRSGRTDERDRLSRGDVEVHVTQHRVGRVVPELDVFEDDVPLDRR